MLVTLRRRLGVPSLRRRLGVRLRSALAAAVVVAIASLLAGGVLLVTARGILLDNVNSAANDKAAQIAAALKAETDLNTLLRPTARDRAVVQVLDAGGQVEAASDALAGETAISTLSPGPGKRIKEQRHLPGVHEEPFWIVAQGVSTPAGPRTVLVAESLDTVGDSTDAVIVALLLGLPLLALTVGVATFLFVGRTLRPVEAMRRQADTITSRNLHERLPVPATDDEIAALASTMNTMLDRIEASSAAQRRFVGDASHELRSPLATVRANADLLDTVGLPESAARSVGRIRTESTRMARLVEDLLLLARADNDELRMRRQDVDLDDLDRPHRYRRPLPGLLPHLGPLLRPDQRVRAPGRGHLDIAGRVIAQQAFADGNVERRSQGRPDRCRVDGDRVRPYRFVAAPMVVIMSVMCRPVRSPSRIRPRCGIRCRSTWTW
jgi:HAMP domain-containing protein